ncbi:PREDICTED: prolyl 3-hydroxylase OGFOD1 [Polistes dominula]|uniref:uS12 prolyl 3-hydroxylase n=1 Tax=Polistes dominula TaxID=743375 RepID=A0ABM1IHI2_POLDO|nr:PREDICTED: prolyl 3-hydroxylase OGFOD1 [Polistes dominula]
MSINDSMSDELSWKKPKNSIISDHLENEIFKTLVTNNWCNYKEIKTDQFEIITKPFRVCKISNFLDNKHFLKKLKSEIEEITYQRKFTDLHHFEQSNDLKSVTKYNIKVLYSTFQKEMTKWMKHVTKIELNNKISMSSSVYSDADYLLCHDDNMGERKIAYILYLSSKWLPEYGGTLDLFDTDENGLPRNVVRSLLPEFNSLVFFEVTDNSFHQVAEVLTSEKTRSSINGWFEGPITIPEKNRPLRPVLPCKYIEPMDMEINLQSWINYLYIEKTQIKSIQKMIEKQSYLLIVKFFLDNVYDKLSKEIVSENICWKKLGPADERNYEIADETTLPRFLKNFYDMFKSKAFFNLLKSYTELDLVSMEPNMKPKMTIELQRWTQGCYTLIVDKSNNQQNVKDIEMQKTKSDVLNIALQESKKIFSSESSGTDSKETNSSKEINGSKYFTISNKSKKNLSKSGSSENSESTSYSTIGTNIGKRHGTPLANNECEEESEVKRNKISKEVEPDMKWRDPALRSDISRYTATSDISSKIVNIDDVYYHSNGHYSREMEEKREYDEYEEEEEDNEHTKEEEEDEMNIEIENGDEVEDEDEDEDEDGNEDGNKEGFLDVILQFHTKNMHTTNTIDYIKPNKKHGLCIQIPAGDNNLSFVYRTGNVTRVHKYVNHYFNGYFYNLICTYTE